MDQGCFAAGVSRATKTTFGVSFPDPSVLERGKRKAAFYGISFSKYVCLLIERDLQSGGPVTLTTRPLAEEPISPQTRADVEHVMEAMRRKIGPKAKAKTTPSDR